MKTEVACSRRNILLRTGVTAAMLSAMVPVILSTSHVLRNERIVWTWCLGSLGLALVLWLLFRCLKDPASNSSGAPRKLAEVPWLSRAAKRLELAVALIYILLWIGHSFFDFEGLAYHILGLVPTAALLIYYQLRWMGIVREEQVPGKESAVAE